MAQMTETKYNNLRKELLRTKAKLNESMIEQQRAQGLGDLRENEEYITARARTESLSQQKSSLEVLIAEAEIVPEDHSPRIGIGSVVDVTPLDNQENPVGSTRRFTLEFKGSTVLDGVLGVKSSLGKVIMNGADGVYKIPDNGGLMYRVTKVLS